MPSPNIHDMQAELERRLLEHNIQTAQALGKAIAMRDHDTGAHNLRVALYSGSLGEEVELDQQSIRDLIAGAFLHDLGKIAVPDSVLLKPGPLSDEEKEIMRGHCEIGAQLLADLPAFQGAIAVVRHHHERYDGNGYPHHLAGESIPLIARAFAVVDVFDALMSARPYKQAFRLEEALEEIAAEVGTHFDPAFSEPFLGLAPSHWRLLGNLSEEALMPRMTEMRQRHFGA